MSAYGATDCASCNRYGAGYCHKCHEEAQAEARAEALEIAARMVESYMEVGNPRLLHKIAKSIRGLILKTKRSGS